MECKHDWCEVMEGTSVRGDHLHVYKCSKCGILDVGIEEVMEQ